MKKLNIEDKEKKEKKEDKKIKDNRKKVNPKIVVIGGGTGNSTLLKGLKNYTKNIVSIVAMADNGGGTGVLREDFGMLPPGDIRACLIALSNGSDTLTELLNFRFTEGNLKGQNFGNLFLAALNGISGSFRKAVKETSKILNITGKVYPSTLANINLNAVFEDGKEIFGEHSITEYGKDNNVKIKDMNLISKNPEMTSGIKEEIQNADLIVIGPGSLYTSIIPNLLVKNMVDEINKSSAIKIYISNVMTENGETDHFSVKKHYDVLEYFAKDLKIDKIISNDFVLDSQKIIEKYKKENQEQVIPTEADEKYFKEKNIELIKDNIILVDEKTKKYIKHDADRLSQILIDIYINESETKKFK